MQRLWLARNREKRFGSLFGFRRFWAVSLERCARARRRRDPW